MDTKTAKEFTIEDAWADFDFSNQNKIYHAQCYILWGKHHLSMWKARGNRRVHYRETPQRICVELIAKDKESALLKLNTNAYEFICWK